MIKLIKNELIKLLRKKSFYIVTIVFILFCILTNVVYKTGLNYTDENNIDLESIKAENKELDLTNSEDLVIYVENLCTIEKETLKNMYSSNIANYLIDNYLTSIIFDMYEAKYILDDLDLYQKYNDELNEKIKNVASDNWQYFLNLRIAYLEERFENTQGIENKRYNKLLELAYYRKEKNIAYDADNFLHNSLDFVEKNTFEYINLLNDDNKTNEEKERLEYLEKEMNVHEYILKYQQDILNESSLRSVLINFSQEFGLFILIYVVMIAGSIVSEEFSKGTIKYLLTKPYKRFTILTSKLLIVILLIPIIMLFMSILEIGIGGIILGFDSLKVPVVLFLDNSVITYSVIQYLAYLLFSSIPIYLVIGILAFMISTISCSTSAAITVSFLFYLLANIIANLALVYNIPVFKFFVSLYWDFSYLVNNSLQPYGASVLLSSVIISAYIIFMLIISYLFFIRKDIKNI